MPMSPLTIPTIGSITIDVGDQQVERALRVARLRIHRHAVAGRLAAAVDHLVAVVALGEVVLDLDHEVGVGELHLVAGGRAEQVGVLAARDDRHYAAPSSADGAGSVRPAGAPSSKPRAASRASASTFVCRRVEAAVDEAVEADEAPGAGVGGQRDLLGLAGLEAHARAGGDVEVHPPRPLALEAQRPVDLEEVEVRAHLDRPVAGVGDPQRPVVAAGIDLDVVGAVVVVRLPVGQRSLLVCAVESFRRLPGSAVGGQRVVVGVAGLGVVAIVDVGGAVGVRVGVPVGVVGSQPVVDAVAPVCERVPRRRRPFGDDARHGGVAHERAVELVPASAGTPRSASSVRANPAGTTTVRGKPSRRRRCTAPAMSPSRSTVAAITSAPAPCTARDGRRGAARRRRTGWRCARRPRSPRPDRGR